MHVLVMMREIQYIAQSTCFVRRRKKKKKEEEEEEEEEKILSAFLSQFRDHIKLTKEQEAKARLIGTFGRRRRRPLGNKVFPVMHSFSFCLKAFPPFQNLYECCFRIQAF